MGFEYLIRFTVSYGGSKAGTERTDKPNLHYYRYCIQKIGYRYMSRDDLQEEVSKIGWLSGWMIFKIYKPACLQR